MRGLDRGEAFLVTRNGVPVGELTPIRSRSSSLPASCLRRSQAVPRLTLTDAGLTSMRRSTRTPPRA